MNKAKYKGHGYGNYFTVSAVYKFLKKEKINPDRAKELLEKRAKMKKQLAKAVVEMWIRDPLKHIYGPEVKRQEGKVTPCPQ